MELKFRNLETGEIECRIGQVSKSGKGLSLLLYKTARTDARILDEVVGPMNWQNDYKTIDGKLFCGIGICLNGDDPNYRVGSQDWVWKWDTGTESNMEAQKGEASDAFKRAGFKWGIGVALYDAPFIWVPADRCNITKDNRGKFVCYDRFSVSKIAYSDDGKIVGIRIDNENTGHYAFSWKEVVDDAVREDSQASGE